MRSTGINDLPFDVLSFINSPHLSIANDRYASGELEDRPSALRQQKKQRAESIGPAYGKQLGLRRVNIAYPQS
jgi:hypothetical protein